MFKNPPEAKGQSPVKPDNPMSRVRPVVRAPRAPRPASRMCRDLVVVQARPALRLVSPIFKAPAAALVRRAPRPASPMFRGQPEARVQQAPRLVSLMSRVRAVARVQRALRPASPMFKVVLGAWAL